MIGHWVLRRVEHWVGQGRLWDGHGRLELAGQRLRAGAVDLGVRYQAGGKPGGGEVGADQGGEGVVVGAGGQPRGDLVEVVDGDRDVGGGRVDRGPDFAVQHLGDGVLAALPAD